MKGNLVASLVLLSACIAGAAPVDDSKWVKGPSDAWFVNWDKALVEAHRTGRPLFVLRTGSDWCYWCKRLEKDVIDTPRFAEFLATRVVPVYLDNPKTARLGPGQAEHNGRVARALAFGGGVPSAGLFTPAGGALGWIGGGGLGVEPYLQSVSSLLEGEGRAFGGEAVQLLFSGGYAKLVEGIEAFRAKPVAEQVKCFKAKLTGVAVVDADVKNPETIAFLPPGTELEVPFGKRAVFRVEYDFPVGYGAFIWASGVWPKGQADNSRHFSSKGSDLHYGRGTVYSSLGLLPSGPASTVETLGIRTDAHPKIEAFRQGWEIGREQVHIRFLRD